MDKYTKILAKYWNYPAFRELQEEIILSIASGKDTLGLMPTGGGKSITYQVYSLSTEGICLVITPLIALMKDQVENLKRRGIKAVAIYSGMTSEEINIAFDNAIWGDYKFLYLSPERISTSKFLERLPQLNVNLIAVDEAHCISQWGYDFRPSYLKIAELRSHLPGVNVLAITATATELVVNDIQEKLLFAQKNVLRKSFIRSNLTYKVRYEEDKIGYLIRTLRKAKGCGIVYTRSRKKTKEIAELLVNNNISATFYHAGLSSETRNLRQDEWLSGRKRIIVATNAFGMGIDKPNVRFVVHIDTPDSIEAYFQEAGRAGRDGESSVAVLLYNNTDSTKLKKGIAEKFPDTDYIKNVYNSLGNYLQIAVGFGKNMSYDFNMMDFIQKFHLSTIYTFNALKILEREDFIVLTDEINSPSLLHFRVDRDDLYKFQVANEQFDSFVKLVLRSYTGLFSEYCPIDEVTLANRAKITTDLVYKYLNHLDYHKIVHYIPRKKTPLIIYTKERIAADQLKISKEGYDSRKKQYQKQVNAVISYATTTSKCRSQMLLAYFGETNSIRCGNCDVCESMNSLSISNIEFKRICGDIKQLLEKKPMFRHELFFALNDNDDKKQQVIRWLIDNKRLAIRIDERLEWASE